jgi:hypothetical protein
MVWVRAIKALLEYSSGRGKEVARLKSETRTRKSAKRLGQPERGRDAMIQVSVRLIEVANPWSKLTNFQEQRLTG